MNPTSEEDERESGAEEPVTRQLYSGAWSGEERFQSVFSRM